MQLTIHNSFCKLTGDVTPEARELVKQVLTYRNDIDAELSQLYFQLNQAKRFNNTKMYHMTLGRIKNLKANEWVCWFHNDVFPTGHLNLVREALRELGASVEEVDAREVPKNDVILKWNNKPFAPRYYQREMIDLGLREGRGVFVAAVGSGKSLVLAYILKELSVKSLVVVPSVALGLQLENDFVSWFGRNNIESVTTANVRKGKKLKPIRIVTVQTLASLQKSGEIQALVNDVRALFVDEIHHAGSASYTNLLSEIDHVYYRFGFTGTFLRNDSKSLDMWGFLSNVLYKYSAAKAISDGFLVPIEPIVHQMIGHPNRHYQKEYDANYCSKEMALELGNSLYKISNDKQVLILVNKKDKAGELFSAYLTELGLTNTYISGDNKKDDINAAIRLFNEKKIRILIGTSVIGEGIDIRSTDHLFLCQGGKSEIVIVQGIGRCVRPFPNKTIAYVHDFYFENTKYMKKHAIQRADIIRRNFDVQVGYN